MDSAQALEKIKLLLQLSKSQNENESSNALNSIEVLKRKYNITDEEIENYIKPSPVYSVEKNILFKTNGSLPTDWKERLSVIITKLCSCYIIQEQNFLATGESFFVYYIYGDEENVFIIKKLYEKLSLLIEDLLVKNCADREEYYRESYADGLVEGLLNRIEEIDFEIKRPIRSRNYNQENKTNGDEMIAPKKELPKEKPIEKTAQVGLRSKEVDHVAFFKGEMDAFNLELNNEEFKLLETGE